MAYESRFYVVEKGLVSESIRDTAGDDKVWAEKIAMFDLCSVPEVSNEVHSKYHPTDCYIYEDNGNDMIVDDKYGDPLIEVPIKDMIDIIGRVIPKTGYYRRYLPFLAMLKGFSLNDWNNLVVLHYGH